MSPTGALNPVVGEKRTHVRYELAFILMFVLIIAFIDRVNVSVMIADKAFLTEMGISNDPVSKGALMSVFMICYGIGNVILGPLGDWMGPRKAMLLSIFTWAVACVAGGLTTTIFAFLVTRAFLGFGEGLHWPMQSNFVKNWFPNHERGKANSIWLMGMNLAPVIAMPLFAALILWVGWRGTMFTLAGLGILPLILIWWLTTDHPHQHKRINQAERDYIETALAEEKAAEAHIKKSTAWENIKIISSDYRFWLIVIYYAGSTSINFGAMAWLPAYLKDARGFSWAAMGMLSSLPFILKIVALMIAGPLSDKVGRRAPFGVVGLYCSSILIWLGAYVQSDIASALCIAFGVGFMATGTAATWALLQRLVPAQAIGTGAGMMNGFNQALASLAPVAIGVLISITGSYVGGLMYLVGCGVLGGTAYLILSFKGL